MHAPPAVGELDGDERVGAVVEVEQRALGAFEEHPLVGGERSVDDGARLGDVGLEALGVGAELLHDLLDRVGGQLVDLREDVVLLGKRGLDLLGQDVLVLEVLDADAQAARLVHVGRADASARGADLGRAQPVLRGAVEVLVVRHDQVRVAADEQAVRGEAVGLEAVHLVDEHARGR